MQATTPAATRRQDIFPYFDGREDRFADPMRANRLLIGALDGDPDGWLKKARAEEMDVASPAMERLVEATVKAFGLTPFDPKTGDGLTEDKVLEVFFGFLAWMQKKSANTGNSPTSPAPTPATPYPTTTNAASACG